MSEANKQFEYFSLRVKPLLETLYDKKTAAHFLERLYYLLEEHFADRVDENLNKWTENNVQLITYGDSILKEGEKPLVTLDRFLDEHLRDTLTGVHILPFFPYSSDDGFAVIDYLKVDPQLGDWEDIQRIAGKFNLMVDLVIDHVSSQHAWFEQFKQGIKPGCDYFIEVDPATDLSQVVRPRSTPLLAKVSTVKGEKYVWATFSEDQIDVNFANPEVFLEYVKIILFYIKKGAKYIRLDAVGFLWKKIGTPCIHLPETHTVIRLLREIVQMLDPMVALISETNVPNRENLSYFGNRNEAHMIYNFSLPPLILNALLQGKSDHLKTWMMSMPPAPIGCAYLNFTASHDGIGLRPTEGLLYEDEYQTLLEKMQEFGGKISMRKKSDGTEVPYEVNISFFDAMQGTAKGKDKWQIQRFLCSQTIMLALEGIPAFYIHSLLATPNHLDGVEKNGRNRSINRYKWDYEELEKRLKNPKSPQSIVLKELSRRIKIRRKQPAFHPNATQYTLHPLNKALFVFWRQSIYRDQSIFCINNLSDRTQKLRLSDLNLFIIDPWCDLLSGHPIENLHDKFTLKPYQCAWITNKF
ncbi:alpha-amylase [Hydrococcus rivularis NIES-593]|uniref:Alpha-amylase n=1 Tax=Hydrococcus rivularis NIES-593 TaxID=1921803 RepID=A0A1U7HHM2_9CYAN|nr:alpha-amylase family glycosyl hydrolase [Hydrococcus rivularis]OKH23054.1 alpha-amylase [Hydrococcus rivularis NIES-593]